MFKSSCILSLLLATFFCANAATAADAMPASGNTAALEKIDGTQNSMKDCPTMLKKKECDYDNKNRPHKKGEPCPMDKPGGMGAMQNDMKDCPTNNKKEKCDYDNKKCLHKNGEPCPMQSS